LSSSSVDEICKLLTRIRDLQESNIPKYTQIIKDNNLTGCVLLHCNLNELKNVIKHIFNLNKYKIYYIFDLQVLKMNFGDWELFRIVLLALRDKEYLINNETNSNINFKHTRSGSSKNQSHERRGIDIFGIT